MGGFRPLAGSQADYVHSPAWLRERLRIALSAPVGAWPDPRLLDALVHAFHVLRYGLAEAAWSDWRPRVSDTAELLRVIRLYEANVQARPAGWPASGFAALLAFAVYEDPTLVRDRITEEDGFTYDGPERQFLRRPDHLPMALPRLRILAEQMAGTVGDPQRAERAIAKAKRKAADAAAAPRPRISFRTTTSLIAVLEGDPYERIHHQLLLADDHPSFYATLDEAELALIEHEQIGRLPIGTTPSPAVQRAARGDAMPTWWSPPRAQIGPETAWALVLDRLAGRVDETTIELWLKPIEPVSLIGGRLTLTGPAHLVRWAQERCTPLLTDIAADLDLATTIDWQIPTTTDEPAPASRRKRRGADSRRILADRLATDLQLGRWHLPEAWTQPR